MKKESSTNLQKYSGIAEQMLKLFSKHPETAKVLFDIIIYGDEGKGDRKGCILNKMTKIPTEQNKHLPCVIDKVYEITLYLMFNREFMNDVYRTFRIISRGL